MVLSPPHTSPVFQLGMQALTEQSPLLRCSSSTAWKDKRPIGRGKKLPKEKIEIKLKSKTIYKKKTIQKQLCVCVTVRKRERERGGERKRDSVCTGRIMKNSKFNTRQYLCLWCEYYI